MKEVNIPVFKELFREACHKCFGFQVTTQLSEPDSKLLSNKLYEHTGLIIGAKSIKNYSRFVFSDDVKGDGKENPSIASLDTLARYVLDAPVTNEIHRKDNEGHYPYWFQYKNYFISKTPQQNYKSGWKKVAIVLVPLLTFVGLYCIYKYMDTNKTELFYDSFSSVSKDSLLSRGWSVISTDTYWWNKRDQKDGHLTLYTLRGDNWTLGDDHAGIKNLVMREIISDCFAAEIHLTGFFPSNSW